METIVPSDAIGWMPSVDQGGASVHNAVVSVLGSRILGGNYAPGDALPREDELCAMLGVSRTSVREAVKVLSAKGLVEARRRAGVRVLPRDSWRLLDPVVLGWHPAIQDDQELVSGLLEARRIFEPAAAELAARRATAADLAEIERAVVGMRENIPNDLNAVCQADLAFHKGVIAASHNVVLKGLVGMLEAALRATFLVTNPLMEAQSRALSAHVAVLEAIRIRDTAGARAAMNRLLDIAADDLHAKD
ncbi:FadR/GntR family transcriptional regulator [Mesorhizobium sp. M1B.F.Ca.ET.045.04.1.1]|uniref:FadR/GntR family transcriptional regulator n=1 Tax=Mesorhizobium sp. M1B.F.Ca.ET.045.04.1.1 TaxID=2493673 RepID=UPI000F75AD9F|nr:FadR/GntR family transcriptional regulator [Mesorhizobium sp. M1B.F.Ca.ET.045.04.1.1]AZO27744.1 FadR family transcriptional regulator [Mesorhizobium sp. M1B.F.Ca.ET.045.04.1.1]